MPPWTGSRRNRHAALWALTARVALARFRHGLCGRRREADAADPRLAGRRFMARQAMITVRHAPADNAGETIARNVKSHPALAAQHLPRRCRERRRAGVPARHRLDAAKAARHRTTGITGLGRSIRGARLMPESIRFAMSPGTDLRSGLENSAASSPSNARVPCKGPLQQPQFGKALPAFAIAQAGKVGSMLFQESQHRLRGCPTVVS